MKSMEQQQPTHHIHFRIYDCKVHYVQLLLLLGNKQTKSLNRKFNSAEAKQSIAMMTMTSEGAFYSLIRLSLK